MTFEDKFMEIQVGMISLAMEYVQNHESVQQYFDTLWLNRKVFFHLGS